MSAILVRMSAEANEDRSRFPVTVWPAVPLAEVAVDRRALEALPDGGLAWRTKLDPEQLPDEWVLRELVDTDLEDDDAVAHLLETRGVVMWPYFDRAYVPAELHRRLAPVPDLEARRSGDWWERRQDATIEDARWWLKTARALARTWSYTQTGKDPLSAWDAEGFIELSEHELWTQFTLALNAGLHPFRARAEHQHDYLGQHVHTFGAPRVGLYSAACRQVFNLLVDDESARDVRKRDLPPHLCASDRRCTAGEVSE